MMVGDRFMIVKYLGSTNRKWFSEINSIIDRREGNNLLIRIIFYD